MPDEHSDKHNLLNKILFKIIIFLLSVIAGGTVFGLLNKKNKAPEVLLSQGKAVSLMAPSDSDEVAYFELGTIRVSTAGEDDGAATGDTYGEGGTIMILSPWLAYPAGDTVLYEELSRKSGAFRGIFQAYFASRTKNQLLSETEEKIEAVLREEINADLALGKISDIYFTDYLFLE